MINEWWATLPASTQIHYWGYICFFLGFATVELIDYFGPWVIAWLESRHGTQ